MSLEIDLKRKRRFFLTIIILVALALRLYGIGWGLPNQWHPYSYHPDEARLFSYMANMHPASLDFNPDDFAYPTFHVLAVGAFLFILSKIGILTLVPSLAYYASHPHDFAMIFLAARLVTVAMAVASVYLVYLIGQNLYNLRVGLWAAFLFAIAPVNVVDAHYFTLDIPMVFWMLLTLLFSIYIYRYREGMWYVLAGVSLGLATSTKYPGASAVIFILASHALAVRKAGDSWKALVCDKRLWLSAIIALAAFAVGTPYSVLEMKQFSGDLTKTYGATAGFIDHDLIGYNQILSSYGHGWIDLPYVHSLIIGLPFAMGWAWYLFCIVAACILLKDARRRWPLWILFSFGLIYLVNIGRWFTQGQRYYIPFLAVAAVGTAAGYQLMGLKAHAKAAKVLWALMIAYTLIFTLTIDLKFNDTIDEGFSWAFDHIESGSTVAATLWAPLRYSPLGDPKSLQGLALDNERIIAFRRNDMGKDDSVPTTICRDAQKKQCKTFNVVTMINPSDAWLKKYSPQWIILSSLEYIGDNPPPKLFNLNTSNGRDFYRSLRKSCAYPSYELTHVIDQPYFTEILYTSLEPRYTSYFPSPRLEFYKKVDIKI